MTKKLYNCPSVEVIAVQATNNLLGASKPFTGGGGATDPNTQPMY